MGSASEEKEALSLAREVRRLTFGDLDATAQQEARRLASECGKPATREQGLLAIHAILQRRGEPKSTDQHCWERCGSTRQRFYEWKGRLDKFEATAGVSAGQPSKSTSKPIDAKTGLQQDLHVQQSWIPRECPSIAKLESGPLVVSEGMCPLCPLGCLPSALSNILLCPCSQMVHTRHGCYGQPFMTSVGTLIQSCFYVPGAPQAARRTSSERFLMLSKADHVSQVLRAA